MTFPKYETRSLADLKQHYDVEKRLAIRLKNASFQERRTLYGSAYAELLQSVPLHPHHTRKASRLQSEQEIAEKLLFLRRFLKSTATFLEVGAGNCKLSLAVAQRVKKVYALEISEEVVKNAELAENVALVLSDGCAVPISPDSVDLAYSYQVMEHVHPEDATQQLCNIYRVLAPGGIYICVTPNRVSGPHDISQYFDSEAKGLHLKEYTWGQLSKLFRVAGFSRVDAYVGFKNHYFRLPVRLLHCLEAVLLVFPYPVRRWLTNLRGIRNLLFITAVGVKS